MSRPAHLALVSFSLLLWATVAHAQTYSADELRAIFLRQMDAARTVETDPAQGRTRGLTLNAVEPAAKGAGASVEAGAEPDSGGNASGAAPKLTLNPSTYLALPAQDQVNVRIVFDFDSAAIPQSQKPALHRFCTAVDAVGIKHFRIIGHTDSAGTDDYNRRLSVMRAEAVRDYFIAECRITPNRLEAIGVGEQFLADPGNPRAGVNRRVEFQALG